MSLALSLSYTVASQRLHIYYTGQTLTPQFMRSQEFIYHLSWYIVAQPRNSMVGFLTYNSITLLKSQFGPSIVSQTFLLHELKAVGKDCPLCWRNAKPLEITLEAPAYARARVLLHDKTGVYSRTFLVLGIGFARQMLEAQMCNWCFLCHQVLTASSLICYGNRTNFNCIWRQF